ncbi:unnamed protein product [Brachionus calyciflorus]|uniref:Uncharacterized protein n=1 Tax=Brachionus calyciflorus TaxID=104777 RepID=A0A814D1D9_9BILA|nr:unnamed protein product [Brachionus calyciflorus]
MEGTRHNLLVTRSERDLEVQIRDDLKWEDQVNIAVNKSNKALGMLKNSFKYLNKKSFKMLYSALVRPNLEYAVSVWSPILKKDVNAMESIQRSERRERGDLIQMFKIANGIDSVNLIKGINFKYPTNQLAKLQGHKYRLEREIVRNCPSRNNLLRNRVVNKWNKPPESAVNAEIVNNFKMVIDKKVLATQYS